MQNVNGQHSIASRRFPVFGPHVLTWIVVSVFVVGGAPSCGKSSSTVAIKGGVSYHNVPIKAGTLTFFPATGRAVTAAISGGEYRAELMPGEYSVVVSVAPELPPSYKEGDPPPPPPKVVLPDEYTTRAKSMLKATVIERQKEPVDFDLK